MKGGIFNVFSRRQLYLFLIILLLSTLLLWAWEKKPFATNLILARNQFSWLSSEFHVDSVNNSSPPVKPNNHIQEKTEETARSVKNRFGALLTNGSDDGKKFSDKEEFLVDSVNNSSSPVKPNNHIQEKTEETARSVNNRFGAPLTNESDDGKKFPDKEEACDYAKGSWAADSKRPFYSGLGCKRWLSGMWACRLTQRTDFSYEGYRWLPKNCGMPEFERSAFLKRMQDKTIAFIGDSLGRQQFQSLMCMATGGEDSPEVEDVARIYGLVKPRRAIRPDGWVYRFPDTNTTILYYWSATLGDLVPFDASNKTSDIALHIDRPAAFMRKYLHRFDVLVLNTGHHWNRGKFTSNRWVMHVNGKPNEDGKLDIIANAKNFTVQSVVRWLDSQLRLYPRLRVFFRTMSPRHYHNGDWNTGGTCNNTTPLIGGSEVTQNRSSDKVVEAAVKGTRIKILDITALSELRDEGHISHYSMKKKKPQTVNDCLHWCLPGIPDTWNELLIAQL